ncbi:MAG: LysM peptidoglycan-binding domain-containing protein [Anaerolineae bacterium]
MSNQERRFPRLNFSKRPTVPLVITLLVIAVLVALGVTRPWQRQGVAAVTSAATDAPTLTPRPTFTTTSTATPTSTPTATSTATPTPMPVIYVVQSGDTLLSIAIEYDTTVDALLQANDLDEREMIYAGQELVIVTPAPTAEVPSTLPFDPAQDELRTGSPTPEPTRFLTHIVQAGESLTSIATDYGTTVEAIVAANRIEDPRSLRTGQELIIPLAGSVGGPTPVPGAPTAPPRGTEVVVHVVQPGDSLLGIALQYDTSVEVIMAANDLADAQWIFAGQELLIPLGTPTPVPTPTPRPKPTPTPGPPYAAPDLLDPAEGETFRGEEADIVLNWASVGILAEDEWYILRLRLMTEPVYQHPSVWTKTTSWRVPASLRPSVEAESHLFRWDVTVVRHTGTRPDGQPDGMAISPMSATRSFFWD